MEVLFILIAASFAIAAGFLITFIISVKKGQFDDQETPAIRILFDDEVQKKDKIN